MILKLQHIRMGGLLGALISGAAMILSGQVEMGLGVISSAIVGLNPPQNNEWRR